MYICANTRTSVLKRNLTFPNYKFGKGQYAFHPIKLSRYAEKMIPSEIPKFNEGGDLYELAPIENDKILKLNVVLIKRFARSRQGRAS